MNRIKYYGSSDEKLSWMQLRAFCYEITSFMKWMGLVVSNLWLDKKNAALVTPH